MKFFRLDLLTLLISLFFLLNSCKNQGTIGLGSNASGQLSGTLVDTSTLILNTVREDTVATSGAAKNPLGYFNDPIFGITQSDLATDINLPNSSSYSLPTGTITIDSTRLVMSYADGFYGDSISSSYTVNVYQLGEKYNSAIAYYNDKKWKVSSNLVGGGTFNIRSHDSIKISNIIVGKPDTLIKVSPQLRIPINNSFITNNLLLASGSTLSSNTIFQNVVNGLYLTIDKTKSTGAGGIIMFKKTDTVMVYYRVNTGAAIDTAIIKLPVSNLAASISHTYSAAINTELSDSTTSRGTLYVQGLASLRGRIKFPSLLANLRSSLLKRDSDIVLNRAEIVITPSPGSGIPYVPLPKLSMYKLDIAHQRVLIEDANGGDRRSGGVGVFGGYYSKTLKNYHFIVTAYMQDLLLGKVVDYGTYIAAVDTTNTTTVDIAATPQVAARTLAIGTDKTSPYQIKLNIIYTKIRSN